jgi:PAS domain S-box-containing protein
MWEEDRSLATAKEKNASYRRGAFLSIQANLIGLILLVLVPILLTQAYFLYGRYQYRKGLEIQANLEVARAVAKTFDAFVRSILHQQLVIGSALIRSPMTPEAMSRFFGTLQDEGGIINDCGWVSPEGRVVASKVPESTGFDISDHPYFQAILSGKDWHVSDLSESRHDRGPFITVASGVRNENGNLLGVVFSTILPDKLDSVLGLERSKGAGISIIDSKGMLVYRYPAIHVSWEERNWLRIYPSLLKEALSGNETVRTVFSEHDGKIKIAAVTPIPSLGWVADAGRWEEEAMGPIIFVVQKNIALAFIIAFGSFAAALALSRKISNPISTLRKHALALGKGEHSRGDISGPEELRDLARVFNDMAEEIASRDAEQAEHIWLIKAELQARRQAEEALRESEKKYRELVQNANSAIIRCGSDGTITFFNEYAQAFFGYSKDEAIGRHVNIIVSHKESTGGDALVHEVVKCPEKFARHINENICRDGRRVWMAWTNKPILDEKGEVVEILAVGVDITEQKLMEEELRKSRDELDLRVQERTAELRVSNKALLEYAAKLERLNEELQEFVFVASHDLQEPLRKIQAFATRLKDKCETLLTEEGCNYLTRMEKAANRMSSSLSALLTYSRVAKGTMPFTSIDLTSVAKDAINGLRVFVEDTGALIKIEPLPTLEADADQMRAVFENLVGNALHYRHQGKEPCIRVHGGLENGTCQLIVEDNGIGFDEIYLDRIFKPFQRLHGRSSPYEGIGMGLAIVRKIVERHSGTITAKSKPGEGSTFIVSLPIRQTAANALNEKK